MNLNIKIKFNGKEQNWFMLKKLKKKLKKNNKYRNQIEYKIFNKIDKI